MIYQFYSKFRDFLRQQFLLNFEHPIFSKHNSDRSPSFINNININVFSNSAACPGDGGQLQCPMKQLLACFYTKLYSSM